MKIELVNDIIFNNTILSARLSKPNEILMLNNLAEVGVYKIEEQIYETLFSLKSSIGYGDGGFDIDAQSSIYSLDEIIVIVNNYKRHGYIHYPHKYNRLHLWRGEYHADISDYPIALFKNEHGVPHIIYGCDWNHVQIMNLDTRQILTADKSLIEADAEERHIEFYKKHKEDNKLPWPSRYDYFFGKLHLSPDSKMFLSAGWAWGSCDSCNAYDIKHFINSNRIEEIPVFQGEHVNRAVCWINENTIAITYNPYDEGDDNAVKDSPCEIHYYKINNSKAQFERKVPLNGLNIVNTQIAYNSQMNAIVAISDKIGVAVISINGETLFHQIDLMVDAYETSTNSFLKSEGNNIKTYQICEN